LQELGYIFEAWKIVEYLLRLVVNNN
jgi:hypothetical protein